MMFNMWRMSCKPCGECIKPCGDMIKSMWGMHTNDVEGTMSRCDRKREEMIITLSNEA